jgi:uncharacterized integral membrane protein
MHKTKLIWTGILAVLATILILQNTGEVETRLLFFAVKMPLAFLLLIAVLIGFCLGLLVSFLVVRKKASKAAVMLFVFACAGARAAGPSFPSETQLAAGPWRVRLLPGQKHFVFTSYGVPGELGALRKLVEVMGARHLGNGFDPGPAARASSRTLFNYLASVGWPVMAYPGCADMQVKGGRCILGPEDGRALGAFDRAGLFWAVQLGEWGYYFHNLSWNEGWWHDVFGNDFEAFKHLMKPAGLAGYDRRPAGRRECYEAVRDYFVSRNRDLLGRTISVTGHSHYEAYAAEWGAKVVGLELGENIAFTQSKLAFARGASRQWDQPWSVQVSPWFAGACTTRGPLRKENGYARGLEAGHSLSFYERMWLHAWFAGAAMVTPENSISFFFERTDGDWPLTDPGRKAGEVFSFVQSHERGVPYTPVAIVLDHLQGYNGYMGKPWGILEPGAGDREVSDLLERQLFPGGDIVHGRTDPENPEAGYLCPTPHGELFDVLLTGAKPDVLASYPNLLLAGDITFDVETVNAFEEALRQGSRILLGARQAKALGATLDRWRSLGRVEVLAPWLNPDTGRPAAISEERLDGLVRECLPVSVEGDPIQYQVNRTGRGWVVELVNNRGVKKKPDEPAVIDPKAVARVTLRLKEPFASATTWRGGRTFPKPETLRLELGPGATEFVEYRK